MHAPGHAVVQLLLLNPKRKAALIAPIVAGAAFPDLPIYVFFIVNKLFLGASDAAMWSYGLQQPFWQEVIDVFHSIPIALTGMLLAAIGMQGRWAAFFLSLAVHSLIDLPMLNEDAHRHFYPISDFRFVSPLSHWDPAHYGAYVGMAEMLLVLGCSAALWRWDLRWGGRITLLAVNALYLTGYAYVLLAGLAQ